MTATNDDILKELQNIKKLLLVLNGVSIQDTEIDLYIQKLGEKKDGN